MNTPQTSQSPASTCTPASCTFVDRAGTTWSLELTIAAVRRVKRLVGVDLLRITEPSGAESPEPLLTRLATDPGLLVDVIHAVVLPQAEHAGVGDEAFADRLDGGAFDRAGAAFLEAVSDFFRAQRKSHVVAAVRRLAEALDRATEHATAQVNAIRVEDLLEQAMAPHPTHPVHPTHPSHPTRLAAPIPGGSSPSAPPSPAGWTPTASASGSSSTPPTPHSGPSRPAPPPCSP